jgi:hypothetical protein
MSVDDVVRNFLGLALDEPLAPVAVDEPVIPPRAFSKRELADEIRARPHRQPILAQIGGVYRWQYAPDVVLVETSVLSGREGEVIELDGEVALDGRGGAAMVRWFDDAGERALVNDRGRVSVYDVGAPALRDLVVPDTPTFGLSLPSQAVLLGDDPRGWLQDRVAALLSARSPVLAAAAVGLAGRMGASVREARAWADALSAADRELLVEDALRQAGAARERLERLSESPDPVATFGELVDLRDVLASAEWVLGSAGDPLVQQLEELDREVEVRWSEAPDNAPHLAELCAEVSWREPWSWWGAP